MDSITDELSNLSNPVYVKHPTNYQPNLFTESRQEFTELEKKIVVLVVNQIGHMSLKSQIKPGDNVKLHIPFVELTKARYDQISAAAETLQMKRLIYRNDKSEKFHFVVPFPSIKSTVVDGKKVIELTMFADIVPHFAEIGQRYTKYDIDVMLSLSSVYAQRMFEIVSMFYNRKQKQFRYQVEELRQILNCPDTYSYNDFKKNVLLIAQREIKGKAGLWFDWTPTKKVGKRIIELEFTVKSTQQLAIEAIDQDQKAINKMSINEAIQKAWPEMAKYKLKDWQKNLITSKIELLEIFFRVDSELYNGLRNNIKNPTAYLVKSLGIDQTRPDPSIPATTSSKRRNNACSLSSNPSIRSNTTKPISLIMNDLFSDIKK